MKNRLGGCGIAVVVLVLMGAASVALCCGGIAFIGSAGIPQPKTTSVKADKLNKQVEQTNLKTMAAASTSQAWYEGGTLHHAKMKEWSRAEYANKLATAA